jgi:hypothetical protein
MASDRSAVRARIGESRWETSVFADKASGCYLLPVKATVRKAEGISTGDKIGVEAANGLVCQVDRQVRSTPIHACGLSWARMITKRGFRREFRCLTGCG